MKNILYLFLIMYSSHAFSGFVNPVHYKGGKAQDNEVKLYISERVNKDYCILRTDTCNKSTLREMETRELEYFKKLTKYKNSSVMNKVIKIWCSKEMDLCNYGTIFMMYHSEVDNQ